jgi:glycerophosphoryl diester phosphodiesterase
MHDDLVPLLVAHRGYLDLYPENTWLALEAALGAGACWVEFDVQMCADGRFILLHDADFQRTGATPQSVFETRSDALRHISVHEAARFGDRFAPQPLSSLGEVLEKLGDFPGARAMVEIKTESLQHWGLEPVMDALLRELAPYRDRCVLISFSHAALDHAKRHSDIETGWVLTRYDDEHRRAAQDLLPQFLICNHNKLPAGEDPWDGAWDWMLYEINDADAALEWARRGVGFIETAAIERLLQHPLLARRACRHGR